MTESVMATVINDLGSFRDPANRVYTRDSGLGSLRVLRGVNTIALNNFVKLLDESFFKRAVEKGYIVRTQLLNASDTDAETILQDGWSGVLEHDPIPFISYPYEWSFSMLKDAALLQLGLLEKALENGWTVKDATPYNIQFRASKPVFIDIPSFEPWGNGDAWVGYRQFCSMFLTPLMLRAHLNIDFRPLLRSYLDGIPPTEAVRFFSGRNRYKKGVMSHIVFPARVENAIGKKERDDRPAARRNGRKQSKSMVIGLVQSLKRVVRSLTIKIEHTDWAHYDKTHSYEDEEHAAKKHFVTEHAGERARGHVWDIGCNTGTFSRLCASFSDAVISIDGDPNAIEQLYLAERQSEEAKILPLVMNLNNISPNQGWGGAERKALDARKTPDVVLALALIHHTRISANIPNKMFLMWLRSLNADIIIEFVDRHDEMVAKLLTNKVEQYEDYTLDSFVVEMKSLFEIAARRSLKGGKRVIFYLRPKPFI